MLWNPTQWENEAEKKDMTKSTYLSTDLENSVNHFHLLMWTGAAANEYFY